MLHRFNKLRQHPRALLFQSCPLKGQNFFPSPLLSSHSLPNPRLYELSIKKIRQQFGIRQNTLITKGWCNLILVRGLSQGLNQHQEEKQENLASIVMQNWRIYTSLLCWDWVLYIFCMMISVVGMKSSWWFVWEVMEFRRGWAGAMAKAWAFQFHFSLPLEL